MITAPTVFSIRMSDLPSPSKSARTPVGETCTIVPPWPSEPAEMPTVLVSPSSVTVSTTKPPLVRSGWPVESMLPDVAPTPEKAVSPSLSASPLEVTPEEMM